MVTPIVDFEIASSEHFTNSFPKVSTASRSTSALMSGRIKFIQCIRSALKNQIGRVLAAMLFWQFACPAPPHCLAQSPTQALQPDRSSPVNARWVKPTNSHRNEKNHRLVQQAEAHLVAGEFPAVERIINELDVESADRMRGALLKRQLQSGANQGARLTATAIRDDYLRTQQLQSAHQQLQQKLTIDRAGSENRWSRSAYHEYKPGITGNSPAEIGVDSNGNPGGSINQGGITEMDFVPLINLITDVIATDLWDINDGPGSIRPFAAGVYVDAQGLLQQIVTGKLDRSHLLTTHKNRSLESGEMNPAWDSPQRTISLTRLEKAVQIRASFGLEPTESMKNMGGLTQIDYLFADSKSGEIYLIGPAGDWQQDATGRNVSKKTGRPVMQLDDWIAVLRNVYHQQGGFGCSITPRQENLLLAKQHLSNPNLASSKWIEQLKQKLGNQDVEVFGIDPTSRAARVLVEADYHMKRIGMGLEGNFREVPSYLRRIESDLNQGIAVAESDLARWWFTLKLREISTCDKRELFDLRGTWVQVLSESELIADDGQRIHTNRSTAATAGFAQDFSRNFQLIADQFPIYYDLHHIFQLALAANLIRQEELDRRCNWTSTYFAPGNDAMPSYRLAHDRVAVQVESIINEKTVRLRKGKSTLSHRIVGVSGGVEFRGNEIQVATTGETAGEAKNSQPASISIAAVPAFEIPQWWWD